MQVPTLNDSLGKSRGHHLPAEISRPGSERTSSTRWATHEATIFPPKCPDAEYERTSSDVGTSLVRGHTVSVFSDMKSTLFSHRLFRANGQTVRSQNNEYFGMPYLRRQKYVTSLTSRPNFEPTRVTLRPFSTLS